MTESACQSSEGTENKAAKKVAGRNAIVMMATVFMLELSRFDASAILRLASASSAWIAESSCVRSAKSFCVGRTFVNTQVLL